MFEFLVQLFRNSAEKILFIVNISLVPYFFNYHENILDANKVLDEKNLYEIKGILKVLHLQVTETINYYIKTLTFP